MQLSVLRQNDDYDDDVAGRNGYWNRSNAYTGWAKKRHSVFYTPI